MPGSPTAPGRPGAGESAPGHVAFRQRNGVGTRVDADFAAQWLAYALPDRRFACTLTDADARLGADVGRYSFIVADLHHLLLAGLPAHTAFRPERPSARQSIPLGWLDAERTNGPGSARDAVGVLYQPPWSLTRM